MKFPNSTFIQKTRRFVFHLIHPKGNYFRLFIAFWIGIFFKILLMDFSFFSEPVLKSNFTHKLSAFLVYISYHLFKLLSIPVHTTGRTIALYDSVGVLVDDTCLGYRGIILFSVFILVYYGNIFRKFLYLLFGFIILETGNVLRICILAQIQYCCPEKFDFFHFYLSKLIFYTFIFFLWILWIEKLNNGTNTIART